MNRAQTVSTTLCISIDEPLQNRQYAVLSIPSGNGEIGGKEGAEKDREGKGRLVVDMKFRINIHIHRFYEDIHGYIHIHGRLYLLYTCVRESYAGTRT